MLGPGARGPGGDRREPDGSRPPARAGARDVVAHRRARRCAGPRARPDVLGRLIGSCSASTYPSRRSTGSPRLVRRPPRSAASPFTAYAVTPQAWARDAGSTTRSVSTSSLSEAARHALALLARLSDPAGRAGGGRVVLAVERRRRRARRCARAGPLTRSLRVGRDRRAAVDEPVAASLRRDGRGAERPSRPATQTRRSSSTARRRRPALVRPAGAARADAQTCRLTGPTGPTRGGRPGWVAERRRTCRVCEERHGRREHVPVPVNEPVLHVCARQRRAGRASRGADGARPSSGRAAPWSIGGKRRMGGGDAVDVVQPHARRHVLGRPRDATPQRRAGRGRRGRAPRPAGATLSFDDRAAVILKAADLLGRSVAGNGSTPRPCSASPRRRIQAEIDSACELIDFWRFNVALRPAVARRAAASSSPGVWNRLDHRPLEGFVYAVTPFNFTAIAGNLPTAPALMGNTVVWKPAHTQQFAAQPDHGAARGGGPAAGRDQHGHRRRRRRSPRWCSPTPTSPASTSPARPAVFQQLWQHGRREHRVATAPTRASSARPAARTSSSPTPRADPACCARRWSAGRSSTRARSARAASRAYVPRSSVGRAARRPRGRGRRR